MADKTAHERASAGPATDRYNEPVPDPTKNVMKLVEAASRRTDDLSAAEARWQRRWIKSELKRIETLVRQNKSLAVMRAEHQTALDEKESARIDSIRQVDREEVAKTAAQANVAIATLAKQTTDLATTLQSQVQSTALAAETRRNADKDEANKRISALELAGSASAGKQQIADPAMEALAKQVATLVQFQQSSGGERRGGQQTWGIVIAGVTIVMTMIGLAIAFLARAK
jgi:outer membrane translocation and assembly module TamA